MSQHFCIFFVVVFCWRGKAEGRKLISGLRKRSWLQCGVRVRVRCPMCGMLGDGWLWPSLSGLTSALSSFISVGLLRDTQSSTRDLSPSNFCRISASALNLSIIVLSFYLLFRISFLYFPQIEAKLGLNIIQTTRILQLCIRQMLLSKASYIDGTYFINSCFPWKSNQLPWCC